MVSRGHSLHHARRRASFQRQRGQIDPEQSARRSLLVQQAEVEKHKRFRQRPDFQASRNGYAQKDIGRRGYVAPLVRAAKIQLQKQRNRPKGKSQQHEEISRNCRVTQSLKKMQEGILIFIVNFLSSNE